MQDFRYATLEAPTQSIRVLRILAGDDDDIINCELTSVLLRTSMHTCLSYQWDGEDDSVYEIVVNSHKFKVKSNLYRFLYHARCLGRSDTFWIDAISIDQENHVEKGVQVEIMGEIYELASETLV